jgi:hypothetical protein
MSADLVLLLKNASSGKYTSLEIMVRDQSRLVASVSTPGAGAH